MQDCDGASSIDVTSLGFSICDKSLKEKLVFQDEHLKIKADDICYGDDIREIMTCKVCKFIATEPIKECTQCYNIYCEKCLKSSVTEFHKSGRCHQCNSTQIKPMNRIGKELALKKLRFRHRCRSIKMPDKISANLDQHVLDGLEQYFQVIDPSASLLKVLI